MEDKSPLIEVLLENKEKILDSGKYKEEEFEKFIISLSQAENERKSILNKIKEYGKIDIEKLKENLGISEEKLIYNIEYLKELGLLEFIGEISEFYQRIDKKNEKVGLFPDVSIIRDLKICSGCGLCVSICPINAIDFSSESLTIDVELCFDCGLCYACCPRSFFPKELKAYQENIDVEAQFLKELNYYKEIYTAQTRDDSIKEVGQDGGIVTTLLKVAFQEKLIDAALVVGETEKRFEPIPILVQNKDDLLKTAGTKYSNAHILKILNDSKKFKRVAVVGMPCYLEALKKISVYPLNKPFYENIVFKIGLFCIESFDYKNIIEILKKEFHNQVLLRPEEIKKMDIDKGRFIVYKNNIESFDIPIKKINKYSRFGCFFCDDFTAELSGISVGSVGSEPGWSTVIIRNNKGADLFQRASKLHLIEMKRIEKESKSFKTLSRIAKSKLKLYKEIPRQTMIVQDPKERVSNFQEVPQGYTLENVKLETQRCLLCGNPLCIDGCPVYIDIPKFIRLLKQEKFPEALDHMKYFNLLPAICGRVCPQETQCEETCILNSVSEPVAIGNLERFIADWEEKNQLRACPDCQPPKNIKVAVIGSGPAGLTCAGELLLRGYEVTIFEAFHTGGGVLVYGIPEFRLPKETVKNEIEKLKMLGAEIKYNMIIGKILTIDDLKTMGYKAFFIGVGAGLPSFLRVPGLGLNGVLTANELLTRTNLMKAFEFPEYDTPVKVGKIITVIGGGNVTLDSARVALRLGAERVIVVYRRSEKEMPARRAEYHHAKEEGIEFQFLANPVRFIGDENGKVKQMEVIEMRLGEPDESGRRRPIPIENSEYLIETDTVIIAIGTQANPILTNSISELKLDKWGYIETDEVGKTNLEGVYAGGDIVLGSATVISAMGGGKRAAADIDKYLTNKYLSINN